MTVTDSTAAEQTQAISFEFDLPHPLEKVWRALTTPELLTEWLLPVVDYKLEPGQTFAFRAPPQPGWDGAVNCRILEIDAHRKLTYAWVVGDIDTVVTFTLTPDGPSTRMTIVQSGFKPNQKQNFAGARYGWAMMGERLVGVLARNI